MKANVAVASWLRFALLGLGAAVSILPSSSAVADTASPVDYIELFKSKIMPCLHPTVKSDAVSVELRKEPATSGDVTTARVEAFYAGLIKKNSIQADIMVRQSGSIRQLQVKVLSDTSMLHGSCDLTTTWKDF
jgi:hypothetical protein